MTELDLESGRTLLSLIKITEKALDTLNNWLNAKGVISNPGVERGLSLTIGDGCFHLDLNRSAGNPRLLLLIKAELEAQLATFREDFEKL
jgi:hypothetical protein